MSDEYKRYISAYYYFKNKVEWYLNMRAENIITNAYFVSEICEF